MTKTRTLGRRPTLGEVIAYYTQDGFLEFLAATCRTRPVVMIVPQQLHWEPNWAANEIGPGDVEHLGARIMDRVRAVWPEVGLEDRLSYYPSFHQSIGVWPDETEAERRERGDGGKPKNRDCIFEADLPTWRESFQDVYAIVELMDRYGILYRHKFSGHRSLHVFVPAQLLPPAHQGRNSRDLLRRLINWGDSQAHFLPDITRMPYSLNEDTGLVCLPIERGAVHRFRPWEANVHMVEVCDAWEEEIGEGDREKMHAFLDMLRDLEAERAEDPAEDVAFFPDREKVVSYYRGRLELAGDTDAVGNAWQLLVGDTEVPEQHLMEGLTGSDPDARWLTLEAFLMNGTGLSREGFVALLEQEDEYVRPAAVDVLLRFEAEIFPYLVEMAGASGSGTVMGTRAFYLLSQSASLRRRVLDAIVQQAERSHEALIAAACLVGSIVGDWPSAFGLLEAVRDAPDFSETERTQLAALDLMSTMGGWGKKEEAEKAQMLAELGRDITDLLLISVGSPNRRFRRGVVSALAILADERAMDLLIRALGDEYSKVQRRAVQGLIRIGEKAIPSLIEAAASDQPSVRKHAVSCLGYIGGARAKAVLLQALDDGDEELRSQALRPLKRMATVDDIERLQRILREDTWENALLALEAMETVGDEAPKVLAEMAFEERNLAAAYYVALHGDPEGREILAERLSPGDARREDAAEFLFRLEDERCVDALIDRLRMETGWRASWATHRLGRIGGERALAALIEALSGTDPNVRRGAVRALRVSKDPRAVEPLIRCLGDPDAKVRGQAVGALTEMGEPVREPLTKALEENRIRGKRHQNLARTVLGRLGGQAQNPNVK